jgi:hypothetical protein
MKDNQEIYSYKIYKIKGVHYDTGELIKIHDSLFIKILEQYIEFFEKMYPEYKIFIDE